MYANVKDADGNIIKTNEIEVTVYEYFTVDIEIEGVSKSEDIYDGRKNQLYATVVDEIILKAIATCGSGDYVYKYEEIVIDETGSTPGGKSILLKDYSTESSYTYTASSPGIKCFVVYAIDSNGEVRESRMVSVKFYKKFDAKLEISETTKNNTICYMGPVTYTVTATGGSGEYTYKYLSENLDTGEVTVHRDNHPSSVYRTRLASPGKNKLTVYVIDSNGDIVETNSVIVTVHEKLEATLEISDVDKDMTIYEGDSITYKITGKGGSGGYVYNYFIETDGVRDYTGRIDSNVYTKQIENIGEVKIYAYIIDSEGNSSITNTINLTVVKNLESKLSVNESVNISYIDKGNSIVFTATGEGGKGAYMYKFIEYDIKTKKWTKLADYSDANT